MNRRFLVRALLPAVTTAALCLVTAPAYADVPELGSVGIPPVSTAGVPNEILRAAKSVAELAGIELPDTYGPRTAIVVLGFGLLPDGSMRAELGQRLHAGLVQAMMSPASPVIVTGGNPRNGVTEAQAMADWLALRGIARDRIHTETQAGSTVQNALFSAELMRALDIKNAVLITSADHMRRALDNFLAAGVPVVATMTPDVAPLWVKPFGAGAGG
ncbi:YdcF family protein [Nocardia thailandica]|uniref:YdcF family protein n=1 Tax=Nocardia thailandica TaxID=257275 RepID=UPI0002E7EC5C|nr:YdcF family protein [Nocardia thailandica]